MPPRADQALIVDEAREVRNAIERAQLRLTAQVALLQERRKALITAAVTGELAIAGAAA